MSANLLPLDAHAHIDAGISATDVSSLDAFVFAMTRSLDEFETLCRNDRRAVWAIGVHPGLVRSQRAFTADRFRRLLSKTPVVGETGLDGASRVPMSIQLETFRSVLEAAADIPRILSVHSYQAQAEVLRELNRLPVQGVILHWWTGSPGLTRGCQIGVLLLRATCSGRCAWHSFSSPPPTGSNLDGDRPSQRRPSRTNAPPTRECAGGKAKPSEDMGPRRRRNSDAGLAESRQPGG